jgi:hypothetical protein
MRYLDAATGKELYRSRLSLNATFYVSPLAADGNIYCVSGTSGTFVVAAGALGNGKGAGSHRKRWGAETALRSILIVGGGPSRRRSPAAGPTSHTQVSLGCRIVKYAIV